MPGARAILAAAIVCVASAAAAQGVPADARKTKDFLTGDAKGKAADNPQCRLFKPAELAKYVGKPLGAGRNAALGTGCQWVSSDDDADVMVMVVPPDYHEVPRGAKGFKALADVGTRGFVAPQLDGWVAGAIVGQDAVRVTVAGGTAGEASAVALLKETIARRKR